MNNLNILPAIAMSYLEILTEKFGTNFHSNIILERAESLKEKAKHIYH